MKTIALLTDFGLGDNYVGVMKGVMHTIVPSARFIDITHSIDPQNIREAAFLLSSSYRFFPKGTVFLVVVDPGVGSQRKAIVVKTRNYYFLGPDNGVLSIAAQEDTINEIVALTNQIYFLKPVSSTFHGRDIFAPCAAHLCRGVPLARLGTKISSLKKIILSKPEVKNQRLCGEILYIDKFGNLVSNIAKDTFEKFVKKQSFSVSLKSKKVKYFYNFYSQAKADEPFLCEGSFGFLEISIRNKSAQEFFKAHSGDPLVVKINHK